MHNYQIIENYRDNNHLREEYFKYTETIFPGINFRDWYSHGFWPKEYNPVSLIDNDRIISNISMARMKVLLNGSIVDAIQLGAVGTLPEYRKQGLSRKLLDYILEKYSDSAEFFFLFADEDVYDFYRKLGFEKIDEHYFVLDSEIPTSTYSARKLDICKVDDFELIKRLVNNRRDLTARFGARDYAYVTLWHILNIHPQNLYYLADEDIIIITTEKDDILKIWDIIYSDQFEIRQILPKIIQSDKITSINYYFPPDIIKFPFNQIKSLEDYGLFVRGKFNCRDSEIKFPATAET